MTAEDLGWLPQEGVHLDRDELARVVVALRALIDGSEPDEPNRPTPSRLRSSSPTPSSEPEVQDE